MEAKRTEGETAAKTSEDTKHGGKTDPVPAGLRGSGALRARGAVKAASQEFLSRSS